MTYYQRICKLCKRKGITLDELSEKTEITQSHLKSWNRYHIYPPQELLNKVAAALQTAPELLHVDIED